MRMSPSVTAQHLVHYDMPCDPNLVSSTIPIIACLLSFFSNNYTAVIRTLLQQLVIFRSERVNETIVVRYNSQEQNLLFHLCAAPVPMYVHVHVHSYVLQYG